MVTVECDSCYYLPEFLRGRIMKYEVWVIDDNGATRYISTNDCNNAAKIYATMCELCPEMLVSISRQGELLAI